MSLRWGAGIVHWSRNGWSLHQHIIPRQSVTIRIVSCIEEIFDALYIDYHNNRAEAVDRYYRMTKVIFVCVMRNKSVILENWRRRGKKEKKLKKKKEGKDWDSPAKRDRTGFEFASIELEQNRTEETVVPSLRTQHYLWTKQFRNWKNR